MKQWFLTSIGAVMMLLISGCGGSSVSPAMSEAVKTNQTMYTQVGMWYEQNRKGVNQVVGTNYNVGIYLPVNTKVTVVGTTRNGVIVNAKGQQVNILNVSKYTGLNDAAFIDRTLGAAPVDLGKFSATEKSAFKNGAVVKGMSKDAVLISRGYPPAHATPSLDTERWRYWKNRWATMYVVFQNNKVSGFVE